MLYSIVVPLKLGTMWFYTGLVIYVAGFVPLIIAYFNNAATPSSEPVVKGVYKISRNPLYFFTALALLGVSIASASLLMMTLIILYSIFQHFIILGEERFCLETYGEAYRRYMERVPRYLEVY
jgi:protein-S-isoprenylcysteine O-methyltransferase Ste14